MQNYEKKTKIVCTIGPSSDSTEMLEKLMKAGMNVCRLNFSHGSHEEHKVRIDRIKEVRERLNLPVAIMLDTKGPEIRLRDFENGEIDLKYGDRFTLTTREIIGNKNEVSVSYKDLAKDVKAGDRILVDDGLCELRVIEVINGEDIVCEARNYATLKNKKGVNVPDANINLPALTERDIEDIKFGIDNEIDFIAASFIRKPEDVFEIRKILEASTCPNIGIISKIESQEGVDNIKEIVRASDGIMVARGDLGVEIETEIMPLVQKEIIRLVNSLQKPVITATQMLDSMIRNPRPTRAEVTDVANAILDGSDAIMLSGETAAGKYPLEAVETMTRIAIKTENSEEFLEAMAKKIQTKNASTSDSIAKASVNISNSVNASSILTATSTGETSRLISKYRPNRPIIAATYSKEVTRALSLVWGVYPVLTDVSEHTDEVIENSIIASLDEKLIKEGDLIVITAGIPVGVKGTTNLIKVHTVGDIIGGGTGIGFGSVTGRVLKIEKIEDLNRFEKGMIIASRYTDKDFVEKIKEAKAVLTIEGGLTSHAAIVSLNYKVPCIVGIENLLEDVVDGEIVTVDAEKGILYRGEARVL
ncbi:pyruvate kinase [Citroniella saccharovorans]|uniref:Pyruvate kinase n=1 Tax=Citroniella saccharovorans TaxID=2053367 RepID=A0AAW9MXH7_9FIRM|nr:pyruvate kinase [Citroniella saccharovorans]MEB3429217.1 pyruvate kinase [Citroniella saccharovorans]